MKKLTLFEVKQVELDMLRFLAKTCNENNIKFYLAFGSLLGAVRHKGIIPWDDDIDIHMYRADYNRLCDLLDGQEHNRYRILDVNIEKKYSLPLAKIVDTKTILHQTNQRETMSLGVYIDVFIFLNCQIKCNTL